MVRFISYVSSVYFRSSHTCSTRNKMSSKSRSKRKPDQVGIDFCLCIVEVLIACYSCKYILKENKCKEILNPVNVVLATRICKKFR